MERFERIGVGWFTTCIVGGAAVMAAGFLAPADFELIRAILIVLGFMAIIIGIAGIVAEFVLHRRGKAGGPPESPDDSGHMFYADSGAEVDFSEVETSGYDGPRLGPEAKWTAKRSRFQHGKDAVPSAQLPDGPLRPAPTGKSLSEGRTGDPRAGDGDLRAGPDRHGDGSAVDPETVDPDLGLGSDVDSVIRVDQD